MKVKDILSYFNIYSDNLNEVREISDNSNRNLQDCVYINISNFQNAKIYIDEAKHNQAALILSQYNIEGSIYISDLKDKLLNFLMWFDNFTYQFKIIGITGTNGKSSLSNFLVQALNILNFKAKNISCVRDKNSFYSDLTTPSIFKLYEILKKADRQQLDYLILEVSSISICEKRVAGLNFDYIFLTNISSDHLDYHKNRREYKNVKLNFIKSQNAINFVTKKFYPINLNSILVKSYSKYINNKYLLYIEGNKISTNLIYHSNLVNLSFVYFFLKSINIEHNKILSSLSKIKTLKGRMDLISKKPMIVIDYAHSASSFRQIVKETKKLFKKKLILLFGAGGCRDKSKRKEYGKIAEKYADLSILTNDNPRGENPISIINEIGKYIKNKVIIIDRKEAIKFAINKLQEDSVLLILGKGNENYIQFDKYKEFHNDYIEVEKCLNRLT